MIKNKETTEEENVLLVVGFMNDIQAKKNARLSDKIAVEVN